MKAIITTILITVAVITLKGAPLQLSGPFPRIKVGEENLGIKEGKQKALPAYYDFKEIEIKIENKIVTNLKSEIEFKTEEEAKKKFAFYKKDLQKKYKNSKSKLHDQTGGNFGSEYFIFVSQKRETITIIRKKNKITLEIRKSGKY